MKLPFFPIEWNRKFHFLPGQHEIHNFTNVCALHITFPYMWFALFFLRISLARKIATFKTRSGGRFSSKLEPPSSVNKEARGAS